MYPATIHCHSGRSQHAVAARHSREDVSTAAPASVMASAYMPFPAPPATGMALERCWWGHGSGSGVGDGC